MWRGVYAVVYTYNRKELVAQCLASVQAQTVPPERIILIDNGGSDGTHDYLAERGMLDDPRLEYVRLEKNTGAAGGLRAGISHAFRRGCAWAWVMDDDVICEPGTLQGLKEAFEANFRDMSEVGFLVSRLIGGDGRANNVPHIDDRRDEHDVCNDWTEFLARGLVKVRIATLTSVLLPRTTLARCGTPRSDFFIWGEDTDYTLRITDWRPGYLVGGSRALHLRDVPGELDILNESQRERPGAPRQFLLPLPQYDLSAPNLLAGARLLPVPRQGVAAVLPLARPEGASLEARPNHPRRRRRRIVLPAASRAAGPCRRAGGRPAPRPGDAEGVEARRLSLNRDLAAVQ
jgi:dTDP-4-dehydrorhamnose reductase